MRISIIAVSAVVATVLLAPAVRAADDPQGRGACRADVEKLCKGVEPGQGRIAQCLKDKEAQVSPGCKQHLTQMREHMQELSEACKGDVDQYCKDVKPGQGRVAKCLKQNEAKLSTACKEQMTKAHEQMQHMHKRMQEVEQACTGDVEQFCKGTRPGGGRLLKCMKQNEGKLSEGCKSAIEPK
jgi:hypothetical protein